MGVLFKLSLLPFFQGFQCCDTEAATLEKDIIGGVCSEIALIFSWLSFDPKTAHNCTLIADTSAQCGNVPLKCQTMKRNNN